MQAEKHSASPHVAFPELADELGELLGALGVIIHNGYREGGEHIRIIVLNLHKNIVCHEGGTEGAFVTETALGGFMYLGPANIRFFCRSISITDALYLEVTLTLPLTDRPEMVCGDRREELRNVLRGHLRQFAEQASTGGLSIRTMRD